MALVRRNNDNGLRGLHSQIDDLFEDFFKGSSLLDNSNRLPSMDVYSEDDKSMVVETQVPGFEEKDININLKNGVLEISGQRQEKEENKNRGYMIRESSSNFYRRVALPDYVDDEKVQAELDKGVLKIHIPFSEKAEPKKIQIKSKPKKTS